MSNAGKTATEKVSSLLRKHSLGLTAAEIAKGTGLRTAHVHVVLSHLRASGAVRSEWVKSKTRTSVHHFAIAAPCPNDLLASALVYPPRNYHGPDTRQARLVHEKHSHSTRQERSGYVQSSFANVY